MGRRGEEKKNHFPSLSSWDCIIVSNSSHQIINFSANFNDCKMPLLILSLIIRNFIAIEITIINKKFPSLIKNFKNL